MTVVSIVLLCVGSNIDNLSAAVVLGLRSVVVPPLQNIVIAAVTMLGTFLAMAAGTLFANRVARAAGEIGGVTIIAIGVWTVVRGWRASAPTIQAALEHDAELRPVTSRLSMRASAGLAVALAANNVFSGLGAGAAGLPPAWTALLSGVVSLVFVGGGDRLSSSLAVLLSPRRAQLLSGLLLIIVGVYELVA